MKVLMIKLGAGGDVVRTTPLLRRLRGHVTWLVSAHHLPLLRGLGDDLRCLAWSQRELARDRKYDLVVNLEDGAEAGSYVRTLEYEQLFGAFAAADGVIRYTDDARAWFDMSLVSVLGKVGADRLKLTNRRSYQELILQGLGMAFDNEPYVVPVPIETDLTGDIAIAAEAGPVWPMKNWDGYHDLKRALEGLGLIVNILPRRASVLEHLADVRNHRCLVSGDSLPMHLALGSATRCVTLFLCTSPWEIHDYGLQRKLVSPLLAEFFYKRGRDTRATGAMPVSDVVTAVLAQLA